MSINNSPQNSTKKPIITRPKTRGVNTSGKTNRSYNYNNNKNRQPARSKSAISYLRSPNTQELEAIRQKLFDNYQNSENQSLNLDDFSTEELNNVLPFLRNYSHKKGNEEDYDNAQTAQLISEEIFIDLKNRNSGGSKEDDENQQNFESQQNEFDEKWKQKFEEYDSETNQKREELKKTHQEQLDKFEQTWAEDMPRKYRKPSPYLLQIKKIERSLASASDFERAKQIHQEYEKQAQIEQEQAQENLNRDYKIAQTKLLQKQQQEMTNLEETRNHHRNLLNVKYTESRKQLSIRSRVVNQKKQQKGRNKNTSPIGASLSFSNSEKGLDDVLLPPLTAPNDPELVETQQKKKREMNKKKLAYQRQNAQTTLARYTVDGQDYGQQDNNDDNQNPQNKESTKNQPNTSKPVEKENKDETKEITNNEPTKPVENKEEVDEKGTEEVDGKGTDDVFGNLLKKVDDVLNNVEQDNTE